MKRSSWVRNLAKLQILFLVTMLISSFNIFPVQASDATAVAVGEIDYDELTLQIKNNKNGIIYYSSDKENWKELEGGYQSSSDTTIMDISWISSSNDYTLYFKGNTIKTVTSVTLPAKNNQIKVVFDKVDGYLDFTEVDEADSFEWRKASDYHWNEVLMDDNSVSYKSFIATLENFRVKGASLVIRIPQEKGLGSSNEGRRPSKELDITIPKRSNAPSITINVSKLNLNTKSTMEYYDKATKTWFECGTNMTIEEIAPEALYKNGGKDVDLMIRYSETEKSSFSKTAFITVPGQKAAPTIGDNSSDLSHYFLNGKLVLMFNKATAQNTFEYVIDRTGYDFDSDTASWKSVTSSKSITLSASSAPNGCKIYIRHKGISQNSSKNIPAVLSSAISSFTVVY